MKKSDNKKFIFKNKSQVWIETAIYTLIGLTLIAVVLTVALPQIENIKDRETVKQTIVALNLLNEKISETRETTSNTRVYNFVISKGKLEIDGEKEIISYKLENSKLKFSEVGEKIKEGDITISTEKYASRYNIIISLNLTQNTNITFNNQNILKILYPGPSAYNIKMFNNGTIDSLGRYIIDIDI